ncbi:MAG: Intein-containing protein [Candidatus Jorgensenbacteria bacterium GW2011_GWA1_48_13]|uniref:Intein-containing protein n=2 Tax=Candidatus Joergenseniibacteriota TaxID=1752739 RepID=A0A0G1W8A0_9BACT|nr:MAG: Intein-containing protein [Candidatus Jorgensenbacteria bacterium GW2011_GWA1_48_13]KKW15011.1 MAG: Intein-containing protein [Candidatus Jorgensenbacteria bacterium GW2011_GWB1_50_10]
MGKRGPKPKRKVEIRWSPEFAYALGLLATDGNLSSDGRHLDLTSQDKEQLLNFMKCLRIKVEIGYKTSGLSGERTARVQFGDVNFYKFLLNIGFSPNKSKTIGRLDIPDKYFFDFLRGHFDGDGTFYSYWDPRWRSSFMFYTVFISASKGHIQWLRKKINETLPIKGHITKSKTQSTYNLKYAKRESLKLLKKVYYSHKVICLSRKRLKIEKALAIMGAKL